MGGNGGNAFGIVLPLFLKDNNDPPDGRDKIRRTSATFEQLAHQICHFLIVLAVFLELRSNIVFFATIQVLSDGGEIKQDL